MVHPNSIQHQWAIITGATSGFGLAIAECFAASGCRLILTGRRKKRLDDIAADFQKRFAVDVLTYSFDIRHRDHCAEMANDLTHRGIVPDILINNAGLASGKSKIQDGLISDWEAMIDTNIKGLLYITRAILPLMISNDKGHIINIGSTAGHWVYPEGNVYNATKFAVRALNEGINLDLAGTRIRCCSIDPGAAETEFSLVRFHGDTQKAGRVYEGYQPLLAEDIARTALFIVTSPDHVNITNVVISPTAQRNYHLIHRKP